LQSVANDREQAVLKHVAGREWTKYAHVAMAALSCLPWVGSVISAAALAFYRGRSLAQFTVNRTQTL
jgi:hypothetical protein